MYKRFSAVMFPVVSVLLIGTVVWGYMENQEKNSVLIKAENQYQRAFHDLSYQMGKLHDELGNALAVNSASHDFQHKSMLNIWRIVSEAQSNVNQLPLSLLPFHKTEELLANMARFAYETSVRDLNKQPLTQQETQTLKALYKRTKELSGELHRIQNQVINKNLRWMDVEVALASENKTMDNTIIDGFKTVDKKVREYSEVRFGPSVLSVYQKRDVKKLPGKKVGPEEIRQKAMRLLNVNDPSAVRVTENGSGTEYTSYTATVGQTDGAPMIQADFLKKGGQLLWFMKGREVHSRSISQDQAVKNAKAFLSQKGYPQMEMVDYNEYANMANVTLVHKKDNILIYPEKVAVRVALDNGEILGIQATDYVFGSRERNPGKPKLTEGQAKNKLNPEFKVQDTALALIENDWNKEVLCYRFTGKINGTQYRLYINAQTGAEEMIEQFRPAEFTS